MNEKEYKELVEKLGKEAADQIKAKCKEIEDGLNAKYKEMSEGSITKKEFEEFKQVIKDTELKSINEKLAEIKEASTTQGTLINEMKEKAGKPERKTLADFIQENVAKLKEFKDKGHGFLEVTSTQLKVAGVTSIAGSVVDMDTPPGSPYLPGLGGDLQIFDITRNPNFILNKVDQGNTNQFRLAWINELDNTGLGTPAEVAEGGDKPLTQHKFKVEISEAKKAAVYIELTEEFEDDVPGLATQVRRMLQSDVIRFFDDQIQAFVISVARPYEITGLNGQVQDANKWDDLGAMLAQVAKYNYVANTIALNPVTMWSIWMQKDSQGRYLTPPFQSVIESKKVEATKVAENNALVGDLMQVKVDIYKEFVLKMGWINDNLIQNKFCIVGEIRYHRYISDNRKKAIVYDALADVEALITSGS